MSNPDRDLSNRLYNRGTRSPFIPNRDLMNHAKAQRDWFLSQVKNQAARIGLTLLEGGEFSKHGSLFQKLYGSDLGDIDVYIVFDGNGVVLDDHGNRQLLGSDLGRNSLYLILSSYGYPLTAEKAVDLIFDLVARVHQDQPHTSVTRSKRGASVHSAEHSKWFDYDVIPAFAYFGRDELIEHVIPRGGRWVRHPTEYDMNTVDNLDRDFHRDPSLKALGFKDVVRVCKMVAKELKLKDQGVTSFVIRFAVGLAFARGPPITWNQTRFQDVLGVLNEWIDDGGRPDPYENDQWLTMKRPFLEWEDWEAVIFDLSKSENSM